MVKDVKEKEQGCLLPITALALFHTSIAAEVACENQLGAPTSTANFHALTSGHFRKDVQRILKKMHVSTNSERLKTE